MGNLAWQDWAATAVLTAAATSFSVGAVSTDRPLLRGTQALFGAGFAVWGCIASSLTLLDTAKRSEAIRRTRNERHLLACESSHRRQIVAEAATDPILAASIFDGYGGGELPTLPSSNDSNENLSELTLTQLLHCPASLIFGPQGSGKSTLVENLVLERCKRGYKAIIIDPHAAYGQWEGLSVIGRGIDYAAVGDWIEWFCEEVRERYKERAFKPNYKPSRLTVVCEEVTKWADNVPNARRLLKIVLADLRKIAITMTFVSHGRTLDCIGGGKGMAKARDDGMYEIELLADADSEGNAIPRFEAMLKVPRRPLQKCSVPRLQPLPTGCFRPFNADYVEVKPPADIISLQKQLESIPQEQQTKQTIDVDLLERSLSLSLLDSLPPKEKEIIQGAIGQRLVARFVYRKFKITKDECLEIFGRWQYLGLGEWGVSGQTHYFDVDREVGSDD